MMLTKSIATSFPASVTLVTASIHFDRTCSLFQSHYVDDDPLQNKTAEYYTPLAYTRQATSTSSTDT